ncbi:hypothetical protein HRTV5_115 [Halorubrum tailed phage 5]|uniref:Uncharacterized protein n=1 Tax=Halorubrum tailed phage 5 TaxID=2847107 RepID=R4T896_9CAUD|nr:hypothetical protein M194_gp014 [Halorubrum tailed phage 5]AGM11085.1 hypothetical protein HRTV5_115 [Halorubrum tailed phage 5]
MYDNYYPDFHDPEMNEAASYDDRDTPGFDMDELDGFNDPMEKVAHL